MPIDTGLFESLLKLRLHEKEVVDDDVQVKDEAEDDGSTIEGEETKDDIGDEMKMDIPGQPGDEDDTDIEEDGKLYLGNNVDSHVYLTKTDGKYEVTDATGQVLLSTNDVTDPEDKKEFIRKAAEKLKLNLSYETLEKVGWFEPAEEDAIADGADASEETVDTPDAELPVASAPTVPAKPKLKPLTKEGSNDVAPGLTPVDDQQEMTIEDHEPLDPNDDNQPALMGKEESPKGESSGRTPNPGFKRKKT